MATTAYTIYSHYDPADREDLERETGQLSDTESADVWQAESIKAFKRKQLAPPRFVPATANSASNIGWSSAGAGSSKILAVANNSDDQVSGWYRSVVATGSAITDESKSPAPSHPRSANPLPTKLKLTKNNWFIQKVLSESEQKATVTPSPSLAEMLARNPPGEPGFKPPVFLAIGPGNRGFTMLQNSGWNEGEALGKDVIRWRRDSVRELDLEIKLGDGEISEMRKVDVVDLTLSDEEPETLTAERDDSGRKALLTPLPTVLKSDRLGIGLKAKTFGPYKASLKRVTHNAEALAAHYQRAEEARKRKEKWGKGRRGFARRQDAERIRRQNMLSYMNS